MNVHITDNKIVESFHKVSQFKTVSNLRSKDMYRIQMVTLAPCSTVPYFSRPNPLQFENIAIQYIWLFQAVSCKTDSMELFFWQYYHSKLGPLIDRLGREAFFVVFTKTYQAIFQIVAVIAKNFDLIHKRTISKDLQDLKNRMYHFCTNGKLEHRSMSLSCPYVWNQKPKLFPCFLHENLVKLDYQW